MGAIKEMQSETNDKKELVEVVQLPILEEQIKLLSADIQTKIDDALALECTAESKVEVKKVRANLSKELKEFETKRIEVKDKIMKPYDDFNTLYKEFISDKFKTADVKLKAKIDTIENAEKLKTETEVKEYFNEYLASTNIDFITYENANINVTLSASPKSLKEQAKTFIDRINDDLMLIDTQEYKAEIIVEYKRSLNASNAITTVVNRHKEIEVEQAKVVEVKPEEEIKEIKVDVDNVDDFLSSLAKPKRMIKVIVSVEINKLQELEKLLNGYDYRTEG